MTWFLLAAPSEVGHGQGAIDAVVEEDKSQPRKQLHTAKRIFERLRAGHAYTGGYSGRS